jgi:hypothetical protein
MSTLFRGIDIKDKSVLDIGGGNGLFSFYAASMGAKRVICLEPEDEGSTTGMADNFQKLRILLGCNNVELKKETFQDYNSDGQRFEIILLHNSVNHLDEKACINLLGQAESRIIYQGIFSKIYSLSNKGAKLIVCDCSRYNFFSLIKTRNPFAPMIEWHKHQSPKVWSGMLSEIGFTNPQIRWSSFYTLRNLGKILTSNKLMAYFLTSHFCLTMDKS